MTRAHGERGASRQGGTVVGVDGSPGAQAALEWAAAHADRLGRPTPVMSWHFPWAAYTPVPFGGVTAPPPEEMQEVTRESLEKVLAHSGLDGLGEPVVASGDAAHVLMSTAAAIDAGAIVVGTRGRGGFASLVLGSTSGHCAEHSRVPVVIVPEKAGSAGYLQRTGADAEVIVVGIDGSEGSERALRYALDYALPADRIIAVASWQVPYVTGYETYVIETANLAEACTTMLDATLARVVRPDDHPVEREVRHGDPRQVLREMATDADALIIGARGTGLLAHLLVGSVSSALIRHPECPTIVVPPTNRSTDGVPTEGGS